jgi:hypothetical protein
MKHPIRYLLTGLSTLIIGIGTFYITHYAESRVLDRLFATPHLDPPVVATLDAVLSEEQEIYRTVLHEMFVREGTKLLVIESQTEGCHFYEDADSARLSARNEDFHTSIGEMFPTVENSTFDDYRDRNRTIGSLFLSDIGFDYVLLSPETYNRFFDSEAGHGWADFYKKYPRANGLIFFSKIGFNKQRDQALVYAGSACGGLCGDGSYVLLRRRADKWAIEKAVRVWIS